MHGRGTRGGKARAARQAAGRGGTAREGGRSNASRLKQMVHASPGCTKKPKRKSLSHQDEANYEEAYMRETKDQWQWRIFIPLHHVRATRIMQKIQCVWQELACRGGGPQKGKRCWAAGGCGWAGEGYGRSRESWEEGACMYRLVCVAVGRGLRKNYNFILDDYNGTMRGGMAWEQEGPK